MGLENTQIETSQRLSPSPSIGFTLHITQSVEDLMETESLYPPSYLSGESEAPSYATEDPYSPHISSTPGRNSPEMQTHGLLPESNQPGHLFRLRRNPIIDEKERKAAQDRSNAKLNTLSLPTDPKRAKKEKERLELELERQKWVETARLQQERAKRVLRKRADIERQVGKFNIERGSFLGDH